MIEAILPEDQEALLYCLLAHRCLRVLKQSRTRSSLLRQFKDDLEVTLRNGLWRETPGKLPRRLEPVVEAAVAYRQAYMRLERAQANSPSPELALLVDMNRVRMQARDELFRRLDTETIVVGTAEGLSIGDGIVPDLAVTRDGDDLVIRVRQRG